MKCKKNSYVSNLLLIIAVMIIALMVFHFVGVSSRIFLMLGGLLLFLIAFFKTRFALLVLIFSMLLSPEIAIGGVTGRDIAIRIDDLLVFIIFFGWFAKLAINKELGFLRKNPLNRPILIYITICIIATLAGFLRGYVNLKEGALYFLKYFEYFLIYFMVINNLRDMKEAKLFVYSMICVTLIVSAYAWYLHFTGMERVTAPFEGRQGEPNTLGGYLLLMTMVILGFLLNILEKKEKIFLGCALFFTFPALLFTLSRGSWLGFIPASLALMVLSKKGKHLLFISGLFLVTLFSAIFPDYVQDRIQHTFSDRTQRTVLGMRLGLDDSAAARIDTWRDSLQIWKETPVIGHGAGSAGAVVDNQYARLLTEVGLTGFMGFFWIIIVIARNLLFQLYRVGESGFTNGLLAGFMAGFIGLLIHSFSAATFIIIRIMEPFWFLAAIVMILPQISPGTDGNSRAATAAQP